ncbi:porin PorA family protein, partial [Arthrospira platensis SPKY1]|nr:porin PorA family protein [Arthrospira platensis SPKY1]
MSASLAAGVVGQLAPAVVDQLPTEGTVELYEFYTADITEWVEPVTGYIVESQVSQRLTYRLNGGDTDIATKSAMTISTSIPEADVAEIRKESEQLLRAASIKPLLVGGGILLTVLGIVL